MSDVVKVIAHLASLTDFDAFNGVYREYFDEPYPVRPPSDLSSWESWSRST